MQDLSDEELRRREAEVETALSRRYRSDRGFGVGYDRAACSAINPLSSEVVKVTGAQRNRKSLWISTCMTGRYTNFQSRSGWTDAGALAAAASAAHLLSVSRAVQ